jgi:hypothetical protein
MPRDKLCPIIKKIPPYGYDGVAGSDGSDLSKMIKVCSAQIYFRNKSKLGYNVRVYEHSIKTLKQSKTEMGEAHKQ